MQRVHVRGAYVLYENGRRKERGEEKEHTGIDDKVVWAFGGILAYTREKETRSSVFITDNSDEIPALS